MYYINVYLDSILLASSLVCVFSNIVRFLVFRKTIRKRLI